MCVPVPVSVCHSHGQNIALAVRACAICFLTWFLRTRESRYLLRLTNYAVVCGALSSPSLSHLIAVALLIVNATHKTIFDKQANKNRKNNNKVENSVSNWEFQLRKCQWQVWGSCRISCCCFCWPFLLPREMSADRAKGGEVSPPTAPRLEPKCPKQASKYYGINIS